jgi:hypothetical protein
LALHPEEMEAAVIRNMAGKTGRTLEQWLAVLTAGPEFARPAEAVGWLKAQGLGHVAAQIVVKRARGGGPVPPGVYRDVLFPPGTGLRALFETAEGALVAAFPGTVVTDCKGYVGFGDPVQYAVLSARRGVLVAGLARVAAGLPVPEVSKGLGGGRIGWKMQIAGAEDMARMVAHLQG